MNCTITVDYAATSKIEIKCCSSWTLFVECIVFTLKKPSMLIRSALLFRPVFLRVYSCYVYTLFETSAFIPNKKVCGNWAKQFSIVSSLHSQQLTLPKSNYITTYSSRMFSQSLCLRVFWSAWYVAHVTLLSARDSRGWVVRANVTVCC